MIGLLILDAIHTDLQKLLIFVNCISHSQPFLELNVEN